MPGCKTHLIGGAAAFSLIFAFYQTNGFTLQNHVLLFAAGLGLSLLGSIFPDIDTASVMQRFFYGAMSITLLILIIFAQIGTFIFAGALCFIIALLRHRTITHSFVFVVLAPLPLVFYGPSWCGINQQSLYVLYIFFTGGTLSHLLLDFYLPKRFY